MGLKIKLLIFLFFFALAVAAQDTPAKDTIKEKRDEMYKNLQDYSNKRKFTKFIHKLIFRPVQEKAPARSRREINEATELNKSFLQHNGKIIRNINIETLDPFGFSVSDTARGPRNGFERFGNGIHIKTKEFTIKNLLLFKQNKPLDSLLVKESERLIRRQRYVRRVIIKPINIQNSKDSVDISIRVLDSWSLIPNGSASTTRTSFELTERNFLGWGHEFANDFDKRLNTGETEYLARYTVPNILNTYINATLNYQMTMTESSLKSFGLERDFFSAYTKWAGGVYFDERLIRDSLPDAEKIFAPQNLKSRSQDYWAGYSFDLYKGNTEEDRTTRLVTTARHFNRAYSETPSFAYDSVGFFTNERLYLASIGLTSRKFVQDKYLFNYDIIEDIPIGKVYSITGWVQTKNEQNRLYLGGKYSFGNYYKWGYLSVTGELGSFFHNNKASQTTLRLESVYFTNIRYWGKWRFRHFIKPAVVFGGSRMAIIRDQINLNGDTGIQGFESNTLLGSQKFLLTLQTQSYSPWDLLGFRISPFANITMGMIGDKNNPIYKSNIFSKIGLGILLTNDYLVFNGFQISFAYYPRIPDAGDGIFKSNSFKNTDLILPDYQVGKPLIVPYQ